MPIKLKPSVVRAALLGGVAAIVIALVAHVVPVVGWLSVPLALGTGALAAILGRHEPGPAISFAKPAAGGSMLLTPGASPAPSDSTSNFAGLAPDSTGTTGQDAGASASGTTGSVPASTDGDTGSDVGATGTGASAAAGTTDGSGATGSAATGADAAGGSSAATTGGQVAVQPMPRRIH